MSSINLRCSDRNALYCEFPIIISNLFHNIFRLLLILYFTFADIELIAILLRKARGTRT